MSEFRELPERVDSTTVDTADLVKSIREGAAGLDWSDVSEGDPETIKALFEPFADELDRYADALGVWRIPEPLEPAMNWAIGEGPRPEPKPAAWLLLQNPDSKYADAEGEHYVFPGRIPNGRRVSDGDRVAFAMSKTAASGDRQVFGVARIDRIVEREDGMRQANLVDYRTLDPPVAFDAVGGDPRPNVNNAINRVPAAFVKRVAQAAVRDSVHESRPTYGGCQDPEFDLTEPAGIRDALHEIIERDLLGPACGEREEILDDPPSRRYVVGTLAPKNAETESLDDELGGAGEASPDEGSPEPPSPVSNSLFASSIGFSFVVAGGIDTIEVDATWGAYDRRQSEQYFTENGQARMVWTREPRGRPFDLSLTPGRDRRAPDSAAEDVHVEWIIRPPAADGSTMVTLFLINNQTVEGDEKLKDKKWVLQPKITVRGPDDAPVFVRRQPAPEFDPTDATLEEEERALLGMIHRKHVDFAIGHGVAVHAEPAADPWSGDDGWDGATSISTSVLPWSDVPVTETPSDREYAEELGEDFEGFVLDMHELATLPEQELIPALRRIPDLYAKWIEARRTELDASADLAKHREAAEIALARAETCQERLSEGVDRLASDPLALDAFRFANRAMRLQRLRSVFTQRRKREDGLKFSDVDADTPAAWRVFQLAFLLLNVPTVVALDHPRRTSEAGSFADLLWFPTGGGKTEAYLGVAAFAVGARRLQGEVDGYGGDGGVTVIMRYTLRLLTLQQFQRGATLVCALEAIRREHEAAGEATWGSEPFRIGLWVGNRATPGTTSKAKRWVESQKGDYWDMNAGSSSPLQLTDCPWCGHTLKPDDLHVETHGTGRGRSFLFCPDRHCDFNRRNAPDEGIPVVTVDEEIYRLLPTFVLATVDKFAQMPWRGETQTLFGRVAGRCARHGWLSQNADCSGTHRARRPLPAVDPISIPANGLRPPDLIIQDELHLISGPLGTLVGLYETAIDELCSWEVDGKTVRPKVIASTATTRRAPEQVRRLFSRQVEVFPPSGLDATDNFFARQRAPEGHTPGRRYLGVCAPGRARAAVLIRIYVAALAGAQWLYERVPDEHKELVDPYLTLLGYFNSLRELGGMRRLIDDDVGTRVYRVDRDRPDRPGLKQRDISGGLEELTSRVRSSKIPEILDRLDNTFPTYAQLEGAERRGKRPIDIVLATNMVSVGVDVQRMGLMVVSGQPKATAEYIQATSRVGRRTDRPGLVITMLNWARPRDLSHYEHFEHYHAVFYRYVEALTLTPFAARALDRGLTGVIASLIRLDGEEFNRNLGADKVTGAGGFDEVIEAIAQRAQNASYEDDARELAQRIRQEVAARLDDWGKEASEPGRHLGYTESRAGDTGHGTTKALLQRPGASPWGPFTVPNSMREVEPPVGLVFGGVGVDSTTAWRFGSNGDSDEDDS